MNKFDEIFATFVMTLIELTIGRVYNFWIDCCLKLAGWNISFGITKKKYKDERNFLAGLSILMFIATTMWVGWKGPFYCIIFFSLIIVIGASIHKYWKGEQGRNNEDLLDN